MLLLHEIVIAPVGRFYYKTFVAQAGRLHYVEPLVASAMRDLWSLQLYGTSGRLCYASAFSSFYLSGPLRLLSCVLIKPEDCNDVTRD